VGERKWRGSFSRVIKILGKKARMKRERKSNVEVKEVLNGIKICVKIDVEREPDVIASTVTYLGTTRVLRS